MPPEKLSLAPISSFVHSSFWNKLAELKINIDKLDESGREIWGFFTNAETTWTTQVLEVDSTSFNSGFNAQKNNVPFHGKIFNRNTVEQFKDCDKNQLVGEVSRSFLENVKSGAVLKTPSMINLFCVLSFSDLKKYHFYYWFVFPVPHSLDIYVENQAAITEKFTQDQLTALSQQYQALDPYQKPYFLIHNAKIHTLESTIQNINEENYSRYYFVFADFINESNKPKTQLKNYAIVLLHHCPFLGGKNLNFISLFLDRKLYINRSRFYELVLPEATTTVDGMIGGVWVGWEKNEMNKFCPRFSNMRAEIDPQVLYEESVDLNLKLMKWRLLPNIDLDVVKNTRCLLLGSGTLGCSVARNLLGWGVRTITFVDNSTVSYSNPVRQHLFTYEDAISCKPKAEAAANNLRKIFPAINVTSHQFTIPMPGHNIGESTLETTKNSVEKLKNLIENHDVIFLLTDSRESRWLPTLMGISNEKTLINVALGFDTYLVMRYGRKCGEGAEASKQQNGFIEVFGNDLGCYFCNDVTEPGNSMKDRSLDQQCTVTRPGVSSIAGALAVELAVSLLQHPQQINAPAFYKVGAQNSLEMEGNEGILGIIPHSIRGFLSSFSHVLPATPKFGQCIACSPTILEAYRQRDFDFLMDVFSSGGFLQELTGLTNLFNDSHYKEVLELEDGEDWAD